MLGSSWTKRNRRDLYPSAYGGTHPALIEGMAYGNVVLVFETPENVEVTQDSALTFVNEQTLADLLVRVVREDLSRYVTLALGRVRSEYSWDVVTGQYDSLFRSQTHESGRVLDDRSEFRPHRGK